MSPSSPERVADGAYQIQAIGARVTVLRAGEDVVLVDAGPMGSLKRVGNGLAELGLSLEQVKLVVLTHYHPDHSGGLGRLVEINGAKVAVHRLEAGIVNGQERIPSPFRNPVVAAVTRPLLSPFYGFYGAQVKVDYLLEDGDPLPVDTEVSVIHTPGHTVGSVSLYVPTAKLLVVGDALQHRFRRLSPPAAAVTADPNQALLSMSKLMEFDFDTICFGHHRPLLQGARNALGKLIEKHAS